MADPIQEIKDKADILELISETIPVKRAGASYLALCPFHNDSKPSMHISSSKGIFKCFACGMGGDVFKFWSEYYQKDFKETLKDLALKYDVQLQEFNETKAEEKNLFIKLHQIAAEFYHQKLLLDQDAAKARKYLKDRNINTKIISEFKLGYAIAKHNNANQLIKHIKAKLENIDDETLVKASLAYKTSSGDYIDRFRERLMIPVSDERSRVIAFGARTLNDEIGPKYINSAETEIYVKGNNLYGLDLAKESIRKKDSVVLVEGFFDVISLRQSGFENIVANQGTALTANQIKKLCKFSLNKKIFLCFDTDQAGEKATDSAAEMIEQTLAQFDYELRVIRVPGEKDPDEYIKENSLEDFEKLLVSAPYYIDYKLDKLVNAIDLNDSYQKEKVTKEVSEIISKIPKEIVQYEYIKRMAEKLKIPERFFKINNNPYQEQELIKPEKKPIIINDKKSVRTNEVELLSLFLLDKSFLEDFLSDNIELVTLEAKSILNLIIDAVFENPQLTDCNTRYNLLLEKSHLDPKNSNMIADIGFLLEQDLLKDDSYQERYHDLIKRIREYNLKMELETLKIDMKKLEPNSKEWMEIYQRKLEHTRKIQNIKNKSN
jgi:DNA primase catalytic core